jgi:hypothetical protein
VRNTGVICSILILATQLCGCMAYISPSGPQDIELHSSPAQDELLKLVRDGDIYYRIKVHTEKPTTALGADVAENKSPEGPGDVTEICQNGTMFDQDKASAVVGLEILDGSEGAGGAVANFPIFSYEYSHEKGKNECLVTSKPGYVTKVLKVSQSAAPTLHFTFSYTRDSNLRVSELVSKVTTLAASVSGVPVTLGEFAKEVDGTIDDLRSGKDSIDLNSQELSFKQGMQTVFKYPLYYHDGPGDDRPLLWTWLVVEIEPTPSVFQYERELDSGLPIFTYSSPGDATRDAELVVAIQKLEARAAGAADPGSLDQVCRDTREELGRRLAGLDLAFVMANVLQKNKNFQTRAKLRGH